MDTQVIKIGIPFFFTLIGLELLYCHFKKRQLYRLNDTISDLGSGTGQQVSVIAVNAALVPIYLFFYHRFAIAHWSIKSIWDWAALFVLVDFLYYWFHRASHRVNFLWAGHVVHHQSEEFNLAVALRQSWLQYAFHIPFHIPLAILGCPPEAALTMIAINTVGQFWFHTRAIGRMGWLEYVLNTPSHHRVHHSRNPKYLDRNYAGVLIIWDRLFGTFQLEREEPVYGIVKPLGSWNVFWANVHYWVELTRLCRTSQGLKDKISVWFFPPERTGGKPPEVNAARIQKYDVHGSARSSRYALGLLVFAMVLLQIMLNHGASWTVAARFAAAGLILWSVASSGAVLESRPWARWMEAGRIIALAATGVAAFAHAI